MTDRENIWDVLDDVVKDVEPEEVTYNTEGLVRPDDEATAIFKHECEALFMDELLNQHSDTYSRWGHEEVSGPYLNTFVGMRDASLDWQDFSRRAPLASGDLIYEPSDICFGYYANAAASALARMTQFSESEAASLLNTLTIGGGLTAEALENLIDRTARGDI